MGIEVIEIEILVNKSIDICWQTWNSTEDIKIWNVPFLDWHCPIVENDLTEGGHFFFRMEAKTGNDGFDFRGKYDKITVNELLEYTTVDNRKSKIKFYGDNNSTKITEIFEPESQTPIDLQRDFCKEVLEKYKKYTEEKL